MENTENRIGNASDLVNTNRALRDLQLQVHTLTAAMQHLMQITKPLLDMMHEASQNRIYTGKD